MSIETNNKLIGNLGSSNIKGSGIFVKGETGNGIDRIEKTSSVGLIDTYTIYFTDGNTTTFTITNGKNGIDGVNGTNGENGKSLQFNWNGTQLGIRTEGSTEYTYVDLKGNKGDKGDKGDPGEVTLEQLNTAVGNATKTTQTTEVSEELTIENCAPVSAKLDIKNGKTIQEGELSPDNIIPIRNVGDNINLFDKDNANILNGYYIHATQKKLLADSNCKVLYIPCTNNETYSISKIKSERFIIGTTSNIPKDTNTTFTNVVQNNSATKLTIQAGANDKYLVVWYYNKSVDTTITEQEILDSIKIEEGSISTPYTPHNCGSADFKVENKNLAKNMLNKGYSTTVNGITYTIIENGAIKVNGTSTAMSELRINTDFSIKKGDYVISGGANNIMFQLIETGVYSKECYANEVNFTLNEDKTSQILRLRIASGEMVNAIIYPMIRQKGTLNDYIEHQEQIKSFPFTEGQVLHKGDYFASDGIHQTRGTLILTGTEGWWSYATGVGGYGTSFKHKGLDTNGLCSHYKLVKDYNTNDSFRISTNGFNFNVKSTFATIDDWKSYLAEQYANGTPIIVEYELAQEIVIPYTTEQEEAYYELQHLLMYEGYTSIECIDEIKPDIQLTYWYNNELNKSYGERFDKVEDSINELEKGEIYSTEEQEIGKWIDGKPLYRRTIILDKPSSIEISNINEYNLLYDNDSFWSKLDFAMIDKTHSFILSNTVNNFNNATLTQGISGTQNENWWFDLRSYNKVNKTIQVCIGQTLINRFWKIYATLEYTKTTD